MRIDAHLEKAARFEATLAKLSYEEDYETMIEDFLLAAAHLVNAALHKERIVREDADIKHNRLFGFLKEQPAEEYARLASCIQQLEQLRPSHVYGKGRNGATARAAERLFLEMKNTCMGVLGREREPSGSV